MVLFERRVLGLQAVWRTGSARAGRPAAHRLRSRVDALDEAQFLESEQQTCNVIDEVRSGLCALGSRELSGGSFNFERHGEYACQEHRGRCVQQVRLAGWAMIDDLITAPVCPEAVDRQCRAEMDRQALVSR